MTAAVKHLLCRCDMQIGEEERIRLSLGVRASQLCVLTLLLAGLAELLSHTIHLNVGSEAKNVYVVVEQPRVDWRVSL